MHWNLFTREPFVTYQYGRDALFKTLPQNSTDIVFIGNSIIQHYELAEYFNNLKVKNRGIGGETTYAVYNRIKSIAEGRPLKVFILLGINDLASGSSSQEIVLNYKRIIEEIEMISPHTKIYMISVLPVSKYKEDIVCCSQANAKILNLNNLLEDLATTQKVTFLDAHTYLYSSGGLNLEYSVDGIHLNGLGYNQLTKYLISYVNEDI
jgi:lysophospholipase L1-like esterase